MPKDRCYAIPNDVPKKGKQSIQNKTVFTVANSTCILIPTKTRKDVGTRFSTTNILGMEHFEKRKKRPPRFKNIVGTYWFEYLFKLIYYIYLITYVSAPAGRGRPGLAMQPVIYLLRYAWAYLEH